MEVPQYVWTQIDSQGRLVVPAEVRRLMKVESGDRIAFVISGDDVGLMTVDQGIERAQAIARKHIKREPGISIVDEFIADRRAEAERE